MPLSAAWPLEPDSTDLSPLHLELCDFRHVVIFLCLKELKVMAAKPLAYGRCLMHGGCYYSFGHVLVGNHNLVFSLTH